MNDSTERLHLKCPQYSQYSRVVESRHFSGRSYIVNIQQQDFVIQDLSYTNILYHKRCTFCNSVLLMAIKTSICFTLCHDLSKQPILVSIWLAFINENTVLPYSTRGEFWNCRWFVGKVASLLLSLGNQLRVCTNMFSQIGHGAL